MNLEKEIQLFEEWCDIFGLPTDEVDGEYNDPRTATAFLAWYEVLNREGYKLVPVEPSKDMLNGGYRVKHDKIIDLGNVYKAMIGAVE